MILLLSEELLLLLLLMDKMCRIRVSCKGGMKLAERGDTRIGCSGKDTLATKSNPRHVLRSSKQRFLFSVLVDGAQAQRLLEQLYLAKRAGCYQQTPFAIAPKEPAMVE